MQASGHGLPKYQVLAIEGDAHDQSFLVECRVEGQRGTKAEAAAKERQNSKLLQRP